MLAIFVACNCGQRSLIAQAIGREINTPAVGISFETAVAKWGRGIATFFSINNQVSATKALKQLGWQPQATMSLLEDIVQINKA
ncbi:MAG: hypothetical protein AAGI69_26385 [Cyanobacteria bacterium P01_H01_bin.21]